MTRTTTSAQTAERDPSRRAVRGLRRRDAALIAVLAALPSLAAAWLIPLGAATPDPSCAPDERAHMAYVAALADGRLPARPDMDLRMAMYPPTLYAAQLAGLALARGGADAPWQYRLPLRDPSYRGFPLARLGSVLLGVLGSLAVAAGVAVATGAGSAALLAGIVTALYPQRFFVSAYVNADALTFAAGAFLFLALMRWLRDGEGDRGLALVGIASGFVLVGKANGYALLPPTACWLAWALFRGRVAASQLARAAALAGALAVPVFAWNALRNEGDFLGFGVRHQLIATPEWQTGPGMPDDAVVIFARLLARSAFMKFSNMSLSIPVWLFVPWLVSLPIGLWAAARRLPGGPASAQRAAAWLAAVTLLSLAAVAYDSFVVDFSPQGRYVLLAAVLSTVVAWVVPAWLGGTRGRRWTHLAIAYLAVTAAWSLWLLFLWPCGPGVPLPGP
jgi:4-amino-4-deoxy-L-arabinose transferase-like glycosyltransferase